MSLDTNSLVKELSGMTVLELSKLVKVLEAEWGVSASAPTLVAQAAPQESTPQAAEKTHFQIILADAGGSKISVIKEVRAITSLGLTEAKALVDSAPTVLKESVNAQEADKIIAQLTAVGAKVEKK